MANQINQDVLDQLLVEVTEEINSYLAKDGADLRKAAEDGPAVSDEESEGSEGPADPAASEASAPDDGGGAPPPEASAPPMDEASAAPAPDGMAPQGDQQAIEPAPSVEALQGEYMKLDPEALKMHYLACKSALMAQMGAGPEASAPMAPEASAPAAAPPGAAPPAAPPMGDEMSAPAMKGELKAAKDLGSTVDGSNGGEMSAGKSLGKSEKDAYTASLEAKLAKQEEEILNLAMKLTAPLRKSVKGISDLAFISKEGTDSKDKPSPAAGLNKSEILAKLREKSRSDLKKSDREKINQFTCGVNGVTVKDIEHLLVD